MKNLGYFWKFWKKEKLSKWPFNDEKIPIIDDKGFVNLCSVDYDTHLYRTDSGSIRWQTALGKWMVEVGFKFDERDYCIKLLWNLNQLRKSIDTLVFEAKKYDSKSNEYNEIISKAEGFALNYFLFHRDLMEYYKTM